MTYTLDTGEITARFRQAGEVERISRPSGSFTRFVAPGSVTNGQFGLFEWHMPANAGGPSAHFHKTFSESFYITSGTVNLFDGSAWVDASKGDFLYVPEGGIHAFRNASDEPAAMLILFAPGAPREAYFREIARIAQTGRKLTEDEWTELFALHDQFQVD
jgi:mannose-6-phosphate isomerase-like protein (cupin superfamily)